MRFRWVFCGVVVLAVSNGNAAVLVAAEPKVEKLGGGSYLVGLPQGAKGPPETIYVTENVKGPIPTNDWWSSLVWMPFSERHFPHPLAMNAEPGGLRIYYPGANITANESAIFAGMPMNGEDFVLGHSAVEKFPEKRVDGWSDWFVSVRFGEKGKSLRVSYGHGSPYVYALYEGGQPKITFAAEPKVWSGDETASVLGISVGNRHYGLFGATGSKWTGLKTRTFVNESDRQYFSVAVLPDDRPLTLTRFKQYAYSHVTSTHVSYAYAPNGSSVRTRFDYEIRPYEGSERATLFALYPHQWRRTGSSLLDLEYNSVRGKMKVGLPGNHFDAGQFYPGVLPTLPPVEGIDRERLAKLLKQDIESEMPPLRDTYAEGKWLGRTATLAEICDAYGFEVQKKLLDGRLRDRLESWFTATDPAGKPKSQGLFAYEPRWGTLIGYPASYGSDTELNDHHFHYGYFTRAAASVALRDRDWGANKRWGSMVWLPARDCATPSGDLLFPRLRNFDPYAGHSWASGHAKFGDGNNNESSSEAMNAWAGMVLFGEATGDTAMRDLGIYLYATELSAIEEYWFDVTGENRPKEYTPSVVTMVWGGKGANGTWFSADPEMVHGINWLPWHGGSGYLGRHPEYAARNYAALVKEKGDTKWRNWADIIWLYRGLSDPADALAQFEAAPESTIYEAGNSRANTYVWLKSLAEYGQVDANVTADTPLFAVFRKGEVRTYIAYNAAPDARTFTFSDGTKLIATKQGFVVKRPR